MDSPHGWASEKLKTPERHSVQFFERRPVRWREPVGKPPGPQSSRSILISAGVTKEMTSNVPSQTFGKAAVRPIPIDLTSHAFSMIPTIPIKLARACHNLFRTVADGAGYAERS